MRAFFIAIGVIVATAAGPAIAAETRTAQQQPDSPEYLFLLGRHLEGEGKVDEAIAAHKRAIELRPMSAELRAELAALYARQDRPRDALDAAEDALTRDPLNREANRVLGSTLAAAGTEKPLRPGDNATQYGRRAITALEIARRDQMFDVNIELTLGRLYLQTGSLASAVASFRKVVDDQPGYPEAALLLATAHEGLGQTGEAIHALEESIGENPRFFRGLVRLAQLYDGEHRYKEAAAAYGRAQSSNPLTDLTAPRAAALLNSGDPTAARSLLESSLKRASAPDAATLYLLGQSQRQLKDLTAASATVDRLKGAYPSDPRGQYLNAKLLDDKGQRAEAIAAFEGLIQQSPDDTSFVYEYASLLEKSGRVADAERALRGLLARDPLDANALNSLGYMFAERGERLDEAVSLLQRALKVEPANPSYLDSLGWAYFKQGRLDLADQPLSEAAAKLPSNATIQDHLGDLRFKQQRYGDAAAAWERSLAGGDADVDRPAIEKKLRDVRARLR